jgi:hypothetical protein
MPVKTESSILLCVDGVIVIILRRKTISADVVDGSAAANALPRGKGQLYPNLRTSQVKGAASGSGQEETSRAPMHCSSRCNSISVQPRSG